MAAKASYMDAVAITATDLAAVPADELELVSEFSISRTADTIDGNYLGGDGFKRAIVSMIGLEISLSGHFAVGATNQLVLRNAFKNRTLVYVHAIKDENATVGAEKGEKFACWVTSLEEGRSATDAVTFSASLKVEGAPSTILAAA